MWTYISTFYEPGVWVMQDATSVVNISTALYVAFVAQWNTCTEATFGQAGCAPVDC